MNRKVFLAAVIAVSVSGCGMAGETLTDETQKLWRDDAITRAAPAGAEIIGIVRERLPGKNPWTRLDSWYAGMEFTFNLSGRCYQQKLEFRRKSGMVIEIDCP